MIYDHISNIDRYRGMGDIYEGLLFLQTLTQEIADGQYTISDRAKAGISTYTTKVINESGYETHDRMIDIQFLIKGEEKIKCRQRCELKSNTAYNAEKDFTLYHDDLEESIEVSLGNGYFAILFDNDAHMPQICMDEPIEVKKVVVKVCK